ncbi:MAG: hypothetical protein GJ676_11530 [Rhodobacteraceae bacterium]|nr:hypothetical protein [Paracoccaceae bacterium]
MTDLIEKLRLALRAKEGVGGGDLKSALRKARHRLPRRVRKQAQKLVQAAPLAGHPKLCLTLDHADLRKAGTEVLRYLETVDLADRRKGWWLGMLGAMAFNILALIALVIAVLIWRGLI